MSKIKEQQNKEPQYNLLLSEATLNGLIEYKNNLIENKKEGEPGVYLKEKLAGQDLSTISNEKFLEVLLSTKKPTIFAESGIAGDGSDWNEKELKILGDINVAVDVKVYDNGVWSGAEAHAQPFDGKLLFTPGVLLRNDKGGEAIDEAEVTTNGQIDQEKYNKLVEKRLLPLLSHANETAGKEGKPAVITMPGIGCGQFAGDFKGKMGNHLDIAMQTMLKKHAENFPNIACVYYDSFNECKNAEQTIGNIKYRVRPSEQSTEKLPKRSQLLPPEQYEEEKGEFANCSLYKMVAWDHVSLPGNDFYEGNNRWTDDGVAAAATNVMQKITGIEGRYDSSEEKYLPPESYRDWGAVANGKGIHLIANNNVKITLENGKTLSLNEYEQQKTAQKLDAKKSVDNPNTQNPVEHLTKVIQDNQEQKKTEEPKAESSKTKYQNPRLRYIDDIVNPIVIKQGDQNAQQQYKPLDFASLFANVNTQDTNQEKTLEDVQNKAIEIIKTNELADPNKVRQYSEKKSSQDRQEVMKDTKLPLKDKMYNVVLKMAEFLHISPLKDYCQGKLKERATQREALATVKIPEVTNAVSNLANSVSKPKTHIERLRESAAKSNSKVGSQSR